MCNLGKIKIELGLKKYGEFVKDKRICSSSPKKAMFLIHISWPQHNISTSMIVCKQTPMSNCKLNILANQDLASIALSIALLL